MIMFCIVGSWNELYQLQQNEEYYNNLDFNQSAKIKKLEKKFDNYCRLFGQFMKIVDTQSINPKVFGVGLNGALIRAVVATLISIGVAILKFVFF